jgi:hypothetical protein
MSLRGHLPEAISRQTGKTDFSEIASLAGERSLATTSLFWADIFFQMRLPCKAGVKVRLFMQEAVK